MPAPIRRGATIEVSVPARIHLAGNPSDGYGGAVLSTVVPDLTATVTATPAERISVTGPPRTWDSLDDLAREAATVGHEGGDRLVTAALVTLDRLLPPDQPDQPERTPVAVEWTTTIPRSVGLGGSSALVIATMRAVLACWGLEIPRHELAEAALVAETEELGIAAGLADRVAQAFEATVLTDCRGAEPVIARVRPGVPVQVTLAWRRDAAAPSGAYHRALRSRLDEVRPQMQDLAGFADQAAQALADSDRAGLAAAMDASLDARCALGPVPDAALAPVEPIRRAGGAVNFAGSGGAVVVFPASTPVPAGWVTLPVTVT